MRERGYDWDPELVRRAAPHVQEKIEKLGDFFEFAGFLFRDVSPDGDALDPRVLAEAERTLADVEPFTAAQIESALRGLAERMELKPRGLPAHPDRGHGLEGLAGPLRVLELLGKDRSLERLSAARA